ncbi:ABC transporter ATP-binding protein [Agromyces subbeticus]|uniref:ABC transporter ATP-binding protein n=1 Tax=Agromyces subbeticus TaxID=293890 RepID=UPI0003B6464C|nr:ABC transporter ATP-binding protein [Agromyces subbeticus]
MSVPLVSLRGVSRSYGSPPTVALSHVDFDIDRGEMLAIVGPSGSGKSTLLNLIGTLDRPSTGDIHIDGHDTGAMSDSELSALRAFAIGFVFQQYHLAEGVSAVDNVATGLLYSGVPASERRARAAIALDRVGLSARAHHRPQELSGGERQRVAIARAVVGEPALILADEPTGALDTRSGAAVVSILADLNASGTTVVVITHDHQVAERMPRQLGIRDGELVGDRRVGDLVGTAS